MTLRHLYRQYTVNPDHVTYIVKFNNGYDEDTDIDYYALEIGLVGDKVIVLDHLTDEMVKLLYAKLGVNR